MERTERRLIVESADKQALSGLGGVCDERVEPRLPLKKRVERLNHDLLR